MKKITLLAALFAAFTMNAQIVFSDDFNAEVLDATTFTNWMSLDVDGDGEFWEVFDSASVGDGVSSLFTGFGADSDSWEGSALMPDNYLVTMNPLDLTSASGTSLTFLVGSYQTNATFIADKFSVYLTASNDPAVIAGETPVLTALVSDYAACDQADGSASAAAVTIDLSAFDGQTVYLTFRHYDTIDENSVLIDDVSVDAVLAVSDQTFNNFKYFVDANAQLNLSASTSMESVSLYNVLGQQVLSQKLNNTNEVIDVSVLKSGIYLATITIEGSAKSFKIVKR